MQFPVEEKPFGTVALNFYKALNGYINIDMSTYVQFFSDTASYLLREKKTASLQRRTMLQRTRLNLVLLVVS